MHHIFLDIYVDIYVTHDIYVTYMLFFICDIYDCSVWEGLSLGLIFIHKQAIHRHSTPPRYRNAAKGGPSHGHGGSAQQIS